MLNLVVELELVVLIEVGHARDLRPLASAHPCRNVALRNSAITALTAAMANQLLRVGVLSSVELLHEQGPRSGECQTAA